METNFTESLSKVDGFGRAMVHMLHVFLLSLNLKGWKTSHIFVHVAHSYAVIVRTLRKIHRDFFFG
jgi:hypothetical protein